MTKNYLDKLGVAYEDRNVDEHPEYAQEAVAKSGQMGIPVLDIDGEVILGFNRPAIDDALRAKKLI